MKSSISNYNEFLKSLESSDSLDIIEKAGELTQSSRLKISSRASIHSEKSMISTTSSITSQNTVIVPTALNSNTSQFQKGFELRQFDDIKDFDSVLIEGFSSNNSEEELFTLRFTLTPELLRQ